MPRRVRRLGHVGRRGVRVGVGVTVHHPDDLVAGLLGGTVAASGEVAGYFPGSLRLSDGFQGLDRAPPRTEAIAAWLKVRLEDRLDHYLRRHLHHPIPYRRNAQRSLLAIRFGNVNSPHRTGTIRLRPKFFRQFAQPLLDAIALDVLKRLAIDACRAAIQLTLPLSVLISPLWATIR